VQILRVDPLDVRGVMRSERAALLDLVDDLDPREWDAPTPCPPWTVHDLVAHVLASDLGLLSRGRDREQRGWIDVSGDELAALLARRNQEWIDACVPLSGRVLRDLLHATGAEVDRWTASADLGARADGVAWAAVAHAPAWLCLAREYTERWVHQQHLRDALERPGLVDDAHLGAVLDTFKWAIPVALAETTGVLRIDVTGEVQRTWLADRSGFHADADPDATATIAAEMFWRQCTAPRPLTDADGSLVGAFSRTRAIIV
jgi:uncharacterized protein (TIGR03083 family)